MHAIIMATKDSLIVLDKNNCSIHYGMDDNKDHGGFHSLVFHIRSDTLPCDGIAQ